MLDLLAWPSGSGRIPGVEGCDARFEEITGTVLGGAVSRRRLFSWESRGVDTFWGAGKTTGVAAGVICAGAVAGVGLAVGCWEGVRAMCIGDARIEGWRGANAGRFLGYGDGRRESGGMRPSRVRSVILASRRFICFSTCR